MGPILGGIKQYKYMVILRDLPCNNTPCFTTIWGICLFVPTTLSKSNAVDEHSFGETAEAKKKNTFGRAIQGAVAWGIG